MDRPLQMSRVLTRVERARWPDAVPRLSASLRQVAELPEMTGRNTGSGVVMAGGALRAAPVQG